MFHSLSNFAMKPATSIKQPNFQGDYYSQKQFIGQNRVFILDYDNIMVALLFLVHPLHKGLFFTTHISFLQIFRVFEDGQVIQPIKNEFHIQVVSRYLVYIFNYLFLCFEPQVQHSIVTLLRASNGVNQKNAIHTHSG